MRKRVTLLLLLSEQAVLRMFTALNSSMHACGSLLRLSMSSISRYAIERLLTPRLHRDLVVPCLL